MEKEPLLDQVLDNFIINLNSDSTEESNNDTADSKQPFFEREGNLESSSIIPNFKNVETTSTYLKTFSEHTII